MSKNVASKVVEIPVSTGRKGSPSYREGSFKLELPTLSDEGFAWAIAKYGKEAILTGFIKSHVIAKQAPERKALENGEAKPRNLRGALAQLTK